MLKSEQPYTHYSIADVCPELIFHYNRQFDEIFDNGKIEKFTSGIHGQTNSTRKFHIDKSFGIFGVYLFPHAIPFLFRIAATELTNQMPNLNELLGLEGSELEEKIMLVKTHGQRIKILFSLYYKRAK